MIDIGLLYQKQPKSRFLQNFLEDLPPYVGVLYYKEVSVTVIAQIDFQPIRVHFNSKVG